VADSKILEGGGAAAEARSLFIAISQMH